MRVKLKLKNSRVRGLSVSIFLMVAEKSRDFCVGMWCPPFYLYNNNPILRGMGIKSKINGVVLVVALALTGFYSEDIL